LIVGASTRPHPKPSQSEEAALQGALRYLAYRPRSEAELQTHLRQHGANADAIQRIVERLRRLNYLHDRDFARNAAAKMATQGYGPKRVDGELQAKGVAQGLIRDALEEAFADGVEKKKAQRALSRRYKSADLGDPKQLRRALGFLQRRGYSSEVIYELLHYAGEEE